MENPLNEHRPRDILKIEASDDTMNYEYSSMCFHVCAKARKMDAAFYRCIDTREALIPRSRVLQQCEWFSALAMCGKACTKEVVTLKMTNVSVKRTRLVCAEVVNSVGVVGRLRGDMGECRNDYSLSPRLN